MDTRKKNVVVNIGLLQELDDSKTFKALVALGVSYRKNKPYELAELAQLKKNADPVIKSFKAGKIKAPQFRAEMAKVLGIDISGFDTAQQLDFNTKFDAAWNAMLGDPKVLISQIAELKKLEIAKLILVSNTNEIHLDCNLGAESKLVQDQKNPLKLQGLPLYVQHLTTDKTETAVYDAAIAEQKLTPEDTVFVLQMQSKAEVYKDTDEANARVRKEYLANKGTVLERKPDQKVFDLLSPLFPMTASAREAFAEQGNQEWMRQFAPKKAETAEAVSPKANSGAPTLARRPDICD